MAKRVRSSPRTSSVILSVSIISVSIIGGIVLFPILGIGSILLVAVVIFLLSRNQNPRCCLALLMNACMSCKEAVLYSA